MTVFEIDLQIRTTNFTSYVIGKVKKTSYNKRQT